MMSLSQVAALTTPVAGKPLDRWNAITAALVLGPNRPSTTSLAPRALSRNCSDRTVTSGKALLGPWRRTGKGCSVAIVAVATNGAAEAAGPVGAAVAGTAPRPEARTAPTAVTPTADHAVAFMEILPSWTSPARPIHPVGNKLQLVTPAIRWNRSENIQQFFA